MMITSKFSNYGKDIDIAAPGVKVQTTNINGTYGISSGTAIAAAEVAGAAALYKSINPKLSSSDILQILRNSGSKVTTQCDGNGRGTL
jgi:subtilisin family serine protease